MNQSKPNGDVDFNKYVGTVVSKETVSNERIAKDIKELREEMDRLMRKIDLIFGNNVVVDGKFINISKALEKE
jgi:hypothetical protein